MGVNNFAGGLTFTFYLPDTISNRDQFVASFPTGTIINFSSNSSSITLQSLVYNSTNTSLIMTQSTGNPNYPSGTYIRITFVKYKAPPSTRPTNPIIFTVYSYGYPKMTASSAIAAVANNYTLTILPSSTTVNAYATYSFTITMTDPLTSNGFIQITLDPNLCQTTNQIQTITSNLTISISGTNINPNPSTQITTTNINSTSTYSLTISNLNTSSSNIPAQTLTITINNLLNSPSVNTLTYFLLSTYYTSSTIDLVANAAYSSTITLQPGSITLVSATSTATTTYTFGTLGTKFINQNPIPSNGYIILILPTDLQVRTVYTSSLLISGSQVPSTTTNFPNNNSITFQISSQISSGSTISI